MGKKLITPWLPTGSLQSNLAADKHMESAKGGEREKKECVCFVQPAERWISHHTFTLSVKEKTQTNK